MIQFDKDQAIDEFAVPLSRKEKIKKDRDKGISSTNESLNLKMKLQLSGIDPWNEWFFNTLNKYNDEDELDSLIYRHPIVRGYKDGSGKQIYVPDKRMNVQDGLRTYQYLIKNIGNLNQKLSQYIDRIKNWATFPEHFRRLYNILMGRDKRDSSKCWRMSELEQQTRLVVSSQLHI